MSLGPLCGMSLLLFCAVALAEEKPHITQQAGAFSGGLGEKLLPTAGMDLGAVEAKLRTRLDALRTANAAEPLELDAFGGWANAPAAWARPQPGDYFRVQKLGGVWWFITPEGNPFVSKGVTDVNWLGATLSAGPFHDRIVQKYHSEAAWVEAARERLQRWGFNTVGPWSSASIAARMPHSIIILDMGSGNGPRHPKALVTDYWDPAFAEHAARMVEERAKPYVTDKNLIGYFLDNELIWGEDHFAAKWTLLQWYVSFPVRAPGRAEAIRFVREQAGSLEQFNATWDADIGDWSELDGLGPATMRPKTEAARAVTLAFKLHVFEKYAATCISALRAVDPHHLILGCRYHNYPGDAMIKAAARYFDVISMAFYEPLPPVEEIDAIYAEVDKPFMIEEWTFKSEDSGIHNPHGIYAPLVRTEAERCLAYHTYVERFMRKPYGLAFHWYKWMDNPVLPDKKYSGDHCGLLNPKDEAYEQFVAYISEVNRRVEHWHAQGDAVVPAAE